MNIQSRKLKFIQEFIKLNDEKLIERLEQVLHQDIEDEEGSIIPYSMEDFNLMIHESDKDVKEGNLTDVDKLLKEIESW